MHEAFLFAFARRAFRRSPRQGSLASMPAGRDTF